MKTACFLFVLALAASPFGNAQPVKVTVVPVAAIGKFKAWLGDPVDPARAASAARYPERIDRLPFGRKTLLPIVVTGLPSPSLRDIHLVADVEILGKDGKPLAASPRCCRATVPESSTSGAVMLNHWVLVEPEGGGSGSYTVRVSVTDGASTWTTSETLPYGSSDGRDSGRAIPRLRQNLPPSQAEPGGPGDRRDCLALANPADVIRCAEKPRP